MVRALRYRNYRLFFAGQIVSLVGTWMTNTATIWLVYRLTGSAVLLGVAGFAGQFPAFLLAPFAGIYIDRANKHRLLVATQTLSMLQSLALAVLTFSGLITIPLLIALSAFQGFINAFDMPGRQAFLIDMVENKEDLGNAIALNSSMVNVARLIGPSIGGLLIAAAGEGWCFLVDGVSYLAVIAALLAMQIRLSAKTVPTKSGAFEQIQEGWTYAFGFPPIRSIILLLALISLVGVPYAVLLPIFAGKILHGGAHTLGFLMAASGCGALIGAVWLASQRSILVLDRMIAVATGIFGAALIALALANTVWLSLIILLFAGFGFMVQLASSNTILQTIVEDDKRGRVMSLFMMSFLGTAPFGSLLAGSLAQKFGTQNTILFGGICCLFGAAWFASGLKTLQTAVHPIYRRLGIVPELELGLEEAAQLRVPPEN